jgi:hypothetical protein
MYKTLLFSVLMAFTFIFIMMISISVINCIWKILGDAYFGCLLLLIGLLFIIYLYIIFFTHKPEPYYIISNYKIERKTPKFDKKGHVIHVK